MGFRNAVADEAEIYHQRIGAQQKGKIIGKVAGPEAYLGKSASKFAIKPVEDEDRDKPPAYAESPVRTKPPAYSKT